ncbi:MAG TPA: type I-U CRISPR-associated helicase/endonuclease Cas3 [Planctomycetaceae bacterium]|nr:type I-U CRISPR-associated helicase/endonuclease Cas3 [Planctomycetaceae bacterium]
MIELDLDCFEMFFRELHGTSPYPWQRRLAESAISGQWPAAIDLPTGAGKTACIDIAIFSLAAQARLQAADRTAGRRIFFCVNRRIIVNEAFDRAREIAKKLWAAERTGDRDSILCQVAESLREIAGTTAQSTVPPVDVLEVRGGIYRDNRWARSATQPTIVCTTLDQLGSRLLFRGYGVSNGAAPVQAALTAYDSLILLDEAHISEPFRQTLTQVRDFLDAERWAESSVGVKPFTFVPMTATPNKDMASRGVIRIDEQDRQVSQLKHRLTATKRSELREVKDLVKAICDSAKEITKGAPVAIGIIVNRVATARAIYDQLRQARAEPNANKRSITADTPIELVIGSMRPLDRDRQAERLRALIGPDRPKPESEVTSIVVATQCLEVGADFDFDVLITECASLDALRQRFGRLNRSGRDIYAFGVVLMQSKDVKPEEKLLEEKPADPIYGNALTRTWAWLNANAIQEKIDFGIDGLNELLIARTETGQIPKELLSPAGLLNAPILLPAYLDLWCQTSPQPALSPDVSLFIHGPKAGEPDIQVVWRADLLEDEVLTRADWADVVALLPPTSAECIRVPISRVRKWLQNESYDVSDDTGDTMAVLSADEEKVAKPKGNIKVGVSERLALAWRGSSDSTVLVNSPEQIFTGDTLVIPASDLSSLVLAHIPDCDQDSSCIPDLAEAAFCQSRDRASLRIHPSLLAGLPSEFGGLLASAFSNEPPRRSDWNATLRVAESAIRDKNPILSRIFLHLSESPFVIETYPDGRGVILTSQRPIGGDIDWYLPPIDDGDNDASRQQKVFLSDHTDHVIDAITNAIDCLPLGDYRIPLTDAAKFHDLGKADDRFQAMLLRSDRTDAAMFIAMAGQPLAKSVETPGTNAQIERARECNGLPRGFRHEMLSLQIVEHCEQLFAINADAKDRELILHLIAAHHGHGRPFAPVVEDNELPLIEFMFGDKAIAIAHEKRREWLPPHRLDSGVSERFWRYTKHFGWWGLAYLEAVLRLSDQQASAAEANCGFVPRRKNELMEAPN